MSRDLRRYARSTTTRLIVGALILLFVVGDGLVAVIYGRQAALFALMCTGAGLLPLVLIAGLLWFMGRIARKLHDE
jgi:hypothetical protein